MVALVVFLAAFWVAFALSARVLRPPSAALAFSLVVATLVAVKATPRLSERLARLLRPRRPPLDDDLAAALALTQERLAAIAALRADLPGDPDALVRRIDALAATMGTLCDDVQRLRHAEQSFNLEQVDAELADYRARLVSERDPAVAAEYRRTLQSLEESVRDQMELIRLTQVAFAKVERVFHAVRSLELKALRLRESTRDGVDLALRDELEGIAREIDGILDALREIDRAGGGAGDGGDDA